MNEHRNIVYFCAEEVERQMDGPIQVAQLYDAWVFMLHYENVPYITLTVIEELGRRAKPDVNGKGFRNVPVSIGGEVRPLWRRDEILRAMDSLVEAINEDRLTAQEVYLEYEAIHPFGDGNGRTGKILFNWMNGTLRNPIMPENPYGWSIP